MTNNKSTPVSGEKKHDPDSNKLGFILADNDVITEIVLFFYVYLFIFLVLKNVFLKMRSG